MIVAYRAQETNFFSVYRLSVESLFSVLTATLKIDDFKFEKKKRGHSRHRRHRASPTEANWLFSSYQSKFSDQIEQTTVHTNDVQFA